MHRLNVNRRVKVNFFRIFILALRFQLAISYVLPVASLHHLALVALHGQRCLLPQLLVISNEVANWGLDLTIELKSPVVLGSPPLILALQSVLLGVHVLGDDEDSFLSGEFLVGVHRLPFLRLRPHLKGP